ncbi:hypothetical protein OEZ85_010055 [Tetradesmus obliquus]|uniref:AAA+ ATPase domain-containing protein n=1 Tax=Tetradesmus obliquus TaxID=3088 RepID=A0ABY8TPY1_TETOB|nr:hypothetical protein OEZ85_010055 [Tetradesmus obliquus]
MALLPKKVQRYVRQYLPAGRQPCLMQLQADSGCALQARLSDGTTTELPVQLDMRKALKRLAAAKGLAGDTAPGQLFGSDNRAGVPGTLHRVSAMRGRQGEVLGLTYRVGRHLPGVGLLLADMLASMKRSIQGEGAERPQSLLLLDKPGVGKTTLLRDMARLMSLPPSQGGMGLAVVVVDTTNEIAGNYEQRHSCIGHARRMMVPSRQQQAQVLLEAVQNHAPDVVIIDEISTKEDAAAAKAISHRGVLLVGAAHGSSLGSLLRNTELSGLVGGVTSATRDEQARASKGGSKMHQESMDAATFVSLVELHTQNRMRLHLNVEHSLGSMLAAAERQAER